MSQQHGEEQDWPREAERETRRPRDSSAVTESIVVTVDTKRLFQKKRRKSWPTLRIEQLLVKHRRPATIAAGIALQNPDLIEVISIQIIGTAV